MSKTEMSARIADLEKQLADAASSNAELVAKLASAPKTTSKSREQADKAVALLSKGDVSTKDLSAINEKYPSDPIYFARTILGTKVTTIRKKGEATIYRLYVSPVVAEVVAPEASAEITNPVTGEVYVAPEAEVKVEPVVEAAVEPTEEEQLEEMEEELAAQ